MKRNNNYTLERVSPYGIRIHSDNVISDLYPSTFVRDMTCHFSILLSQSIDHHGFYTIKAEDDKLKKLLCFEDYLFLEYDFDKVLSSIMHNIIFANTTFVEIAFSRNEANEIVGISLFPFDAIKIASFKNYSWFVSRKPDKKICVFKLEKNKYVEFNVKELGLRKNCLKRIVKKLKKINVTASTKFIMDEKMKNKFFFEDFKKKQDILMLKYPQKIGWMSSADNSFLNESYSLFRLVRLRGFQSKCLTHFIEKINVGINAVSDITKAAGTIKTTVLFPQYENEWRKYAMGEISSSALSDIIFPKYSKHTSE